MPLLTRDIPAVPLMFMLPSAAKLKPTVAERYVAAPVLAPEATIPMDQRKIMPQHLNWTTQVGLLMARYYIFSIDRKGHISNIYYCRPKLSKPELWICVT